jgi:7,8-dihydropterin-6-yl-methyl-4-(beta-D-ribofuranosyl)aminobenzene 5'-phosphate synthase
MVTRRMLRALVALLLVGCTAPSPLPSTAAVTQVCTSTSAATPTAELAPVSTAAATPLHTGTATLTAEPAALAVATVTPSPSPAAPTAAKTPIPLPTPKPATTTEATEGLAITILYDNNEYDKRLQTAWGFSCLVEGMEKTILFDTGGDSALLLSNMRTLGIDPLDVDVVIISHVHADHVGGLSGFLKENHDVTVYLPLSLPASFKDATREAGAELIEVHEPVQIVEHAYSTGELGDLIKEQSLVIETSQGLVVITGCAHPGVVNIIREAKALLDDDVHLVLGGFHLCWMNFLQVRNIVKGVQSEEVERVAPCHCSGDLARNAFKGVYGDDFVLVGVGSRLEVRD